MNQIKTNARFRAAFLDGAHSCEALIKNINAMKSKLVPGGWICYDGVDAAIRIILLIPTISFIINK